MDKYEKITDNGVIKNSLQITSVAKREALMDMEKENFGEKKKINKRKHGKEENSKKKSKK
jgi:ATP-dependent RNA helicase DDX49/DBP8